MQDMIDDYRRQIGEFNRRIDELNKKIDGIQSRYNKESQRLHFLIAQKLMLCSSATALSQAGKVTVRLTELLIFA